MSLQGNCAKNILSTFIDVGTSSLLGGKARNAISMLGDTMSFFTDKCKQENTLALLGLNNSADPSDQLEQCQLENLQGDLLGGFLGSPLAQLGDQPLRFTRLDLAQVMQQRGDVIPPLGLIVAQFGLLKAEGICPGAVFVLPQKPGPVRLER